MDTKVCSKCKIVKKVSEFHKQKDKQDGYRSHCKNCRIQTFKNNEEQLIKRRKELRKQNKDKINKRVREHYAKNIDIMRQKSREHYQKNRERLLIRNRLRSKKEKDTVYKALCNLKRKIASVIRGNPKAHVLVLI